MKHLPFFSPRPSPRHAFATRSKTGLLIKSLGLALLFAIMPANAWAQRQMENLNRGVVAVRNNANSVFISWRVLGLEPATTGFNLYRVTDGSLPPTRVNKDVLLVSNFTDTNAPVSSQHTYFVRAVIKDNEQLPGEAFVLPANGPAENAIRIPVRKVPSHRIQFVWVGDLDGDGEYDFVFDRHPLKAEDTQKIEAYTRHGRFLWSVDLGPGSLDRYRIEPGPTAIDLGHWDGVTVYDFDGDGRAEVALRTADGITFGDGKKLSGLGHHVQAMCILDGLTGAERARAVIPNKFIAEGPLGAHLGVGYFNGSTPSLFAKLKNRTGRKGFNLIAAAWDFTADNKLTQRWIWHREAGHGEDAHQIRIFDIDQDGRDEVIDGGYALNSDGSYRYRVGGESVLVKHGDRFHIGDFDPNRPGLEGFMVQQDHPEGLRYIYYDAATGEPIHTHFGKGIVDVGRGMVADIDPTSPGCEYWAFDGLHRNDTGRLLGDNTPWPNLRIWWDGDIMAEMLNGPRLDKWLPEKRSSTRLFTIGSKRGITRARTKDTQPQFYGDILGDWREEIVCTNEDYTELVICTTNIPTNTRLYTLAHNPAYRVAMTIKGYQQCHHVDYFLGHQMKTPPAPNIRYARRNPVRQR